MEFSNRPCSRITLVGWNCGPSSNFPISSRRVTPIMKVQPHKGSRAAHSPTWHPHVEVADQRSRKRCPLFRGLSWPYPAQEQHYLQLFNAPNFIIRRKKKNNNLQLAPKCWIGSCGPDENATVAENWRVPLSPNQSAVLIILTASRPLIRAEWADHQALPKTCLLQKKSLYWEFSLSRHLGARKLPHRPLWWLCVHFPHRTPILACWLPGLNSTLSQAAFQRRWKWIRCNITNTVCLKVECVVTPAGVTLGNSGSTLKSPDGPVPSSTGHSMQICQLISIIFSVIDSPL
jgi:hypothetical protein